MNYFDVVTWAKRNSQWDAARNEATRQLSAEMAGSGHGITSSDINHTAVANLQQEFGVLIEYGLDLDVPVQYLEGTMKIAGYVTTQADDGSVVVRIGRTDLVRKGAEVLAPLQEVPT